MLLLHKIMFFYARKIHFLSFFGFGKSQKTFTKFKPQRLTFPRFYAIIPNGCKNEHSKKTHKKETFL